MFGRRGERRQRLRLFEIRLGVTGEGVRVGYSLIKGKSNRRVDKGTHFER